VEDVHNVRIRGGDAKILGDKTEGLKISAVLFPLLSFLVPKWLNSLEENVRNIICIIFLLFNSCIFRRLKISHDKIICHCLTGVQRRYKESHHSC